MPDIYNRSCQTFSAPLPQPHVFQDSSKGGAVDFFEVEFRAYPQVYINRYTYIIYICIYIYIYIYIYRKRERLYTCTYIHTLLLLPSVMIHQRGVQWKQGVVIYMMNYTSLLHNTTRIHCTPLPLHPPLMNTHY